MSDKYKIHKSIEPDSMFVKCNYEVKHGMYRTDTWAYVTCKKCLKKKDLKNYGP